MTLPLAHIRPRIIAILAAMCAIGVSGCKTTDGLVPVQPVNITSSDLCQIQPTKLTWDIKDTRETIKGVRQFNAKWDSRCSKGKS